MEKRSIYSLIIIGVLIIIIFLPVLTVSTVTRRGGNGGALGYLSCVPQHYSLYTLTSAYIKSPTIVTDYDADPSHTVQFSFWDCVTKPNQVENTFGTNGQI